MNEPGSGSRLLTLRTATSSFADDRIRALCFDEGFLPDPALLGELKSVASLRLRKAAAASMDRLEIHPGSRRGPPDFPRRSRRLSR